MSTAVHKLASAAAMSFVSAGLVLAFSSHSSPLSAYVTSARTTLAASITPTPTQALASGNNTVWE